MSHPKPSQQQVAPVKDKQPVAPSRAEAPKRKLTMQEVKRWFIIIVTILLATLFISFVTMNSEQVKLILIPFVMPPVNLPLSLALLITFILGMLTGWLTGWVWVWRHSAR